MVEWAAWGDLLETILSWLTCAVMMALSRAVLALETLAAARALAFSTRLVTNAAAATTSACETTPSTPVTQPGTLPHRIIQVDHHTGSVTPPPAVPVAQPAGVTSGRPLGSTHGGTVALTTRAASTSVAAEGRRLERTGEPTGEKPSNVDAAEVEAMSRAASSEGTRNNASRAIAVERSLLALH
jgi:hypothetical protein